MSQEWNLSKRVERFAKIAFKGRWAKNVRAGMSAIEPVSYRSRFLAGMRHQLGLGKVAVRGASAPGQALSAPI